METEKLTKQATQEEASQIYEKFPLKAELLAGMKDYGCLNPFLPQESILLPILEGKDLYAESQTSLQRTLAIIISALQRIEPDKKGCQVLIIMPTRSLCHEAIELAKQIGKYMNDLNVLGVVGGISLESEKIKLQEGPSIIFGTPGRLLNAIEMGSLELKWLKLLIVDDADELFGRGFQEQILSILKIVPPDVQMAIISATTPSEVQGLIDLSLRDPVCVRLRPLYVDMKDCTHFQVNMEKEEDKVDFLVNFYRKIGSRHSLIYCREVENLRRLVEAFKKEKFYVAGLDHSVPVNDRIGVIREFLGSSEQILVTGSREFFEDFGCTPSMIPLILHYDLPWRKEEYQRNFGTRLRFSRKQTGMSLMVQSEALALKEIEDFCGIKMEELPPDVSSFF